MKANLDCIRDVLCYIYYNLDDKEKIRLKPEIGFILFNFGAKGLEVGLHFT